jgi:hypothetical protein
MAASGRGCGGAKPGHTALQAKHSGTARAWQRSGSGCSGWKQAAGDSREKEAQRRLTAAPGRREASARRWCSATCTQAEERSEEAGTGEEIDGSLPRRTGHVTSDNGGRDGWRVRCFILSAHGGRWPASSLPGRKAAARRGAENSSTAS